MVNKDMAQKRLMTIVKYRGTVTHDSVPLTSKSKPDLQGMGLVLHTMSYYGDP